MAKSDDIRFAPYSNLVTDFTRGGKPCLRVTSGGRTIAAMRRNRGHSIPWPEHAVRLVTPADRAWRSAMVYMVQLSDDFQRRWHRQPKNFLVVALHDGAVRSYLEKRYGGLASRYAGLARFAVDVAMRQTSTRNAKHESVSSRARKIAEGNVRVVASDGSAYVVYISDNLAYAAAALQNGEADVDFALMKAANSTYGILSKRCGDLLGEDFSVPFPEVKGRSRR